MSREDLYNEYDGKWYHPDKSNEDLVHCEINLPENAPSTYIDRETLWSSVEMAEKEKNAQLCRLMKASLTIYLTMPRQILLPELCKTIL